MKIAYFDIHSGISGDMTLGAFIDAGLSLNALAKELSKLGIKGYNLRKTRVQRGAIMATKFDCTTPSHHHSHRSVREILRIIERSELKPKVKTIAKDIFIAIGNAEAKVHGISPKKDIRLHELGQIDSIIDIVGFAIALDIMEIDRVLSSPVVMGRTSVETMHGTIPIPSPASLELLKGVPVKIADIEAELVTPTGAGILKVASENFGAMPEMKILKIGYGAGSKILDNIPNMLRVIIGETETAYPSDRVVVLEANIDDMNPQIFEYAIERLFEGGALDAFITPIQMKKTRPAFKLSVIAKPGDLESLTEIIFRETTTIGVRYYECERAILKRDIVKVATPYGKVDVKASHYTSYGKNMNRALFTPEYKSCVKLARSKNIPLRKIMDAANRSVASKFKALR